MYKNKIYIEIVNMIWILIRKLRNLEIRELGPFTRVAQSASRQWNLCVILCVREFIEWILISFHFLKLPLYPCLI